MEVNSIIFYKIFQYNIVIKYVKKKGLIDSEFYYSNLNSLPNFSTFDAKFNFFFKKEFNKNDFLIFIVDFKKKNGFFRKKDKLKTSIFNYIQNYESENHENDSITPQSNYKYLSKFYNYNKLNTINYKNINLKNNLKLLLKNNRNILNFFFFKKIARQNKFNKLIKNLIKLDFRSYLEKNFFLLQHILIDLNFFKNKTDLFFFLQNGFIYLNNHIIKDSNIILNTFDIVNINLNSYYYLYYKFHFLEKFYNNDYTNLV